MSRVTIRHRSRPNHADGCEDARIAKTPVLSAPLEIAVPIALLRSEVHAWARRIDVHYREIHVRPMSRKWASCSSRGRLTFDTGLLRQSGRFRAEVIAHELLHLKVPNHGKVFRALLRAHLRTEPSGHQHG